jgi:hypothetical protein
MKAQAHPLASLHLSRRCRRTAIAASVSLVLVYAAIGAVHGSPSGPTPVAVAVSNKPDAVAAR